MESFKLGTSQQRHWEAAWQLWSPSLSDKAELKGSQVVQMAQSLELYRIQRPLQKTGFQIEKGDIPYNVNTHKQESGRPMTEEVGVSRHAQ